MEPTLFEFEKDFAGSLRCIPMAVRFKLDHVGIKLTLQQWSRFGNDERMDLVERACDTPESVASYRDRLVSLIQACTQQAAKRIDVDPRPVWSDVTHMPPDLVRQSESCAIAPPSLAQWAALTDLQRFTLLKLAREGHDNANFVPAMREFGLVGEYRQSPAR
jgi:hypothetical protein